MYVKTMYRVVQKSFPVMNGIFLSLPEMTFGPPCISKRPEKVTLEENSTAERLTIEGVDATIDDK